MRTWIAGLGLAMFIVGCTNQVQPPSNQSSLDTIVEAETDGETPDRDLAESETPSEPIGQPAPGFEGLAGVDDQLHSLKDYADVKAVVVAFTCNSCPVAKAYEDRLIALQNDYGDKGVQLVAINVNNLEADKLPAMKERATEKGFTYPYLYDPTQQVARDYGATVTPHIFLLDGERRFAYIGAVDDNQDEAKVSEQYLRDALDAVLAGKQPETPKVEPFGCSIKYE